MKIKEIRIYGFKSFAEESKVLLNPGITAFVGPNGSGKSNIFDALRWVFGEQSMKTLRCDRIEDLIQNAPQEQESSNFAQVSVIVENEDFFPQFGSEFEIKREFHRNGESEFFLNRVRCRLQDIQALFLNSGTLTYSFLERAEIDKIIQGNTKEMFDDVAGILRYQERREQTKRRLDQTEQDLLRLEDVIGEMERTVRSLKRQCRQAQIYEDLKAEHRAVSLFVMKRDLDKNAGAAAEMREKITRQEEAKQQLLMAIKDLERERQSLKEEREAAEGVRQSLLKKIAECDAMMVGIQGKLEEQVRMVQESGIRRERLAASLQEKEATRQGVLRRLEELLPRRKELDAEHAATTAAVEEQRRLVHDASVRLFEAQVRLKNDNEARSALAREVAALTEDLAKRNMALQNKRVIMERVDEELADLERTLSDLRAQERQQDGELKRIIGEQDDVGARLRGLDDHVQQAATRLAAADNEIQDKQEHANSLKIIADTAAQRLDQWHGVPDLGKGFPGAVKGVVRDLIEVEPGYEVCVDLCLAGVLGHHVVAVLPEDFSGLGQGTYGFVPTDGATEETPTPQALAAVTRLGDKVHWRQSLPVVESLLARCLVVEDLKTGRELAAQFPGFAFVTRDGVLFNGKMIVVQRGDMGFFRLQQVVQETRSDIEKTRNELTFLVDERRRVRQELDEATAAKEKATNELVALNIKRSEQQLRVGQLQQEVAKLESEQGHLIQERDDARNEIDAMVVAMERLQGTLAERRGQLSASDEAAARAEGATTSLQKELGAQDAELNKRLLAASISQERLTGLAHEEEALRVELAGIDQEIERIRGEIARVEGASGDVHLQDLRRQLEELRQQRQDAEGQLPDERIAACTRRQDEIYEDLLTKQRATETIQNEVVARNYELFELQHRNEELLGKAREEFGTDLNEYVTEDIPDVEARQVELRERLAKLGEINPLSVQAYEAEKQRLDEFLAQRNDIIAAKQSLLRSIEELDARARERFGAVFVEIKEQFNRVFANFFEGGSADLVMTDPDKPLTSDVEIVVRVPGKRVKTIKQLSGGEQTLLAVSLLLAFYLVKPAPFCILDEIDAPLDDANIVRFNQFLRDLAQRTQMIIITHNRATMEYADYLYGVTMERPGQSKIVSVQLGDLERLDLVDE